MRVSIIIPVYKVENYIKRCLESVFAQTYSDIECILVDDYSPDNSINIANQLIKEYSGHVECKVIHHNVNNGLSSTRNTGIDNATGDYIYFLDSDDSISSNCIEVLTNLAKKYQGVDIIQGNIFPNEEYEFLNLSKYKFPEFSNDKKWIKRNLLGDIPMTAWNKLVRKDLILQHNLYFEPGLLQEDELWRFFLSKYARSIAFTLETTYFYNTDNINSIQNRAKADMTNSCINWLKIASICANNYNKSLEEASFIFNIININSFFMNYQGRINNANLVKTEILCTYNSIIRSDCPAYIKFAVFALKVIPISRMNNIIIKKIYGFIIRVLCFNIKF